MKVSMTSQILIAAEMQGRDLLRRRLALLILVALPLVFYLSSYLSGGGKAWARGAGGIAMSWSVAGATLFAVLGARQVDPRLVLGGFSPLALMLGRLLLLASLAGVIVTGFGTLMIANYGTHNAGLLLLGLAFSGFLAVPLGLAVAALLPRELEGTLAIIGVVGIEMSLPVNSPAAVFLPLFSAVHLISIASGRASGVWPALLHGMAYGLALFVVALVLWRRRVRVHHHSESSTSRSAHDRRR